MTVLTTEAYITRIYEILDAKFDTHKADIASGIDPIRQLDTIPKTGGPSPAVAVFFEDGTDEDEPQETGETRIERVKINALLEFPYVSREHATAVHNFADALAYTIKKEQELLHPVAGTKLPWLFKAWPVRRQIQWGKAPHGVRAVISVIVELTIDEGETY